MFSTLGKVFNILEGYLERIGGYSGIFRDIQGYSVHQGNILGTLRDVQYTEEIS